MKDEFIRKASKIEVSYVERKKKKREKRGIKDKEAEIKE